MEIKIWSINRKMPKVKCSQEKNFCYEKNTYKDDEIKVATLLYEFYNPKNLKTNNAISIKVKDLLKGTTDKLKKIVIAKKDFTKDDTNSENDFKIDKMKQITFKDLDKSLIVKNIETELADPTFKSEDTYDLYLTLDELFTFKYTIKILKGYILNYYRLVRIAVVSVKDLLNSFKETKKNKKILEELGFDDDFDVDEVLNSIELFNIGLNINNTGKKEIVAEFIKVGPDYFELD